MPCFRLSVSQELFRRFPEYHEGELSKLRPTLSVRATCFALRER